MLTFVTQISRGPGSSCLCDDILAQCWVCDGWACVPPRAGEDLTGQDDGLH